MANPIIALINVLKGMQEVLAVCVVLEDGLFLIAPGGDVIDCSGVFYAEGAGHEATIATGIVNVKPQDLTGATPCRLLDYCVD